jgi:peptidoglycan hydrolase-like protein with peptidoglycan-binding domain
MNSLMYTNMQKLVLLATLFIGVFIFATPFAFAISSVAGSVNATSSVGVALPITDIQIVGDAASSTPVKLVVSEGSLSITNTGGLSALSGTTGSTITFTATVEDANAALATLTYTRGAVGSDTLEVSLIGASEVFFPENNHLYEYIASAGDWNAANAAATGLTRYGATGYLTTITSQEENDFAAARLTNAGWMGASDVSSEGVWRWVTGPESGTQFWSGNDSGAPFGGNYANWATGEPNDSGSNEDCAQFLSGGSGQWNDLPCSGSSLPGYVVEFGASGDMPSVVAKNVDIVTVDSPTIDTQVPADNATNVNGADDIVITFSEAVTIGTGTVALYRADDDTLFESIPVASAYITGSGTAEITINPSVDLEDMTEYYIQITHAAFENASNVAYLGIADTTTWSFTTGDYTKPVFSNFAVLAERDSATVSWSTDEIASSKIVYGVENTSDFSTSEINTTPRVVSHQVTLSGLSKCTEYSYQAIGVDGSINTNTATSSVQTFTTQGCSSGSSATRSRVRTPVAVNTATEEEETNLQSLWSEGKIVDAVALLQNNPGKSEEDLQLAIEILRSYVEQLQSGQEVVSTTNSIEVRDLSLGMTGEDVKLLQEVLIRESAGPAAAELSRVTATGYFGTYTKNSLGEYQLTNGIVPYTGYFGVLTRTQMKQTEVSGLWW